MSKSMPVTRPIAYTVEPPGDQKMAAADVRSGFTSVEPDSGSQLQPGPGVRHGQKRENTPTSMIQPRSRSGLHNLISLPSSSAMPSTSFSRPGDQAVLERNRLPI